MNRLANRLLGAGGLLLASIPLLVFLYLAQFIRLIGDDYAYLGKPLLVGAWDALLYWRENWSGHYSNYLLFGLFAPVATAAPAFFPIILSALGLPGFAWLNAKILAILGVSKHRRKIAIAGACLALAATYNGFYTAETFFWFTGAVAYTLPAVILLLCLALAVEAGERLRSARGLWLASMAVAALAFINAGFSTMFPVFQLPFLALLALSAYVLLQGRKRRAYLSLALAGCLGSFASLLVQISAPGLAHRASQPENFGQVIVPVRDLGELLGRSLDSLLQYAGHQAAFAGFMLTLMTGLFVILTCYRPASVPARPARIAVETRSLWLCLIIQIILLPYLWAHASDGPLFFWRFSLRYALILGANLTAIFALLLLIWKRSLLGNLLNRPQGITIYSSFAALAIAALFALTQARNSELRASTYLVLTAFTLVVMLVTQLAAVVDEPKARLLNLLAAMATGIMLISFAVIMGVSLWGQGFVYERTFAPITFLLMTSGLLWGALAGVSIKHGGEMSYFSADWIRWFRLASLLALFIIAGGIAVGQARRVNDFAKYARIWDETHEEILNLRAAGDPAINTREFMFLPHANLDAKHLTPSKRKMKWWRRLYYGLDYEAHFG